MARRTFFSSDRAALSVSGVDAATAAASDLNFDPMTFVYNAIHTVLDIPASSFSQVATSDSMRQYQSVVSFGKTYSEIPQILLMVKNSTGNGVFMAPAMVGFLRYTYNSSTMNTWMYVGFSATTSNMTVTYYEEPHYPGPTNYWPLYDCKAIVMEF